MFCPKCAADKFSVISVYRNRSRKNGKWVVSDNDTRLVICRVCGQRYFTETRMISEIDFSEKTNRKYEKPLNSDNYYLFDDEEE